MNRKEKEKEKQIHFLVSHDLYQKATELKLRLYMQSKNQKPLLTHHSFDQTNSIIEQSNPRKSMINLSKGISTLNLKEKPRIPIIRDKSVPSTTTTSRRPSTTGHIEDDSDKTKTKSIDRKAFKKRRKYFYLLNKVKNFFLLRFFGYAW